MKETFSNIHFRCNFLHCHQLHTFGFRLSKCLDITLATIIYYQCSIRSCHPLHSFVSKDSELLNLNTRLIRNHFFCNHELRDQVLTCIPKELNN